MNQDPISKQWEKSELIFALALIIIGVSARFLPHLPNFVPITAIALFSGRYFSKKFSLAIPLSIMIISDFLLGFSIVTLFVYFGFLVAIIFGYLSRRSHRWQMIFGSAIASSLFFYLITNFGVYISGNWYPHTAQGLVDCYLMAIPFFRFSLFGDLFYTTVIFGAYQFFTIYSRGKEISREALLVIK